MSLEAKLLERLICEIKVHNAIQLHIAECLENTQLVLGASLNVYTMVAQPKHSDKVLELLTSITKSQESSHDLLNNNLREIQST